MKLQEVSVPLCTAGEEILAGEPGGRKGWSRRQAERAAETPLAVHTIRKGEEIKMYSIQRERERASEREKERAREREKAPMGRRVSGADR